MKMRQQAAQILADTLASTIQLGRAPAVIDAPPSDVADYPALAVWLEKAEADIMNDADLQVVSGTQSVPGIAPVLISGMNASSVIKNDPALYAIPQPSAGVPAVGQDPTYELFAQGDLALLAPGVAVSHLGTIRGRGRLFVGCRYAPKREDVEERIWFAFNTDRMMRIMLPLAGAKLGRYTLAWGYAAAMLEGDEWVNEFSFEQRLWSWMPFSLDVPLLIPRFEPIVTTMLLDLSRDLDATIESKADVYANLPDLVEKTVSSDGSVTP